MRLLHQDGWYERTKSTCRRGRLPLEKQAASYTKSKQMQMKRWPGRGVAGEKCCLAFSTVAKVYGASPPPGRADERRRAGPGADPGETANTASLEVSPRNDPMETRLLLRQICAKQRGGFQKGPGSVSRLGCCPVHRRARLTSRRPIVALCQHDCA